MASIRKNMRSAALDRAGVVEINPITLSFAGQSAHLEPLFRAAYYQLSLRQMRLGLVLGILLYAAFGALDALLVPGEAVSVWLIRYAGVVPLTLAVLLFSYSPRFQTVWQLLLSALIVAAGAGYGAMTVLISAPAGYYYYAGLILVFMWGYTLLRCRFIYATAAGLIIVALYEFGALVLVETPMPILLSNNFFFIGANLVGMVAGYAIEYSARKDFYLEHLLRAEEEKVRAANAELERRVRDRTARLESANEALRVQNLVSRRAERALRASEQRYRSLVENAPLGILVMDNHGWITEANPALLNILGSPSVEATRAVNVLTYPHLVEAGISGDFRRCLESGEEVANERPYTTKWGKETVLRYHLSPIRSPDGQVTAVQAMIEDVSERTRLAAQLGEAQRMEAVGQLAGGVSHEFSDLITIINGYAGEALSHLSEDDPLYEILREIRAAGEHASRLAGQLLSFSQRQRQDLRPVNLNQIIADSEPMIRSLLGENVELRLDLEPTLGTVEADATQMEQVLVNLAVNAREAQPKGGAVCIATANVEVRGDDAERADLPEGSYVCLTVEDQGESLSPEALEHVLEPFHATRGEGTGLGLAAVHGIVRQSGGHIRVKSEPGKGTNIRVYLPRLEPMVSVHEHSEGAEEMPGGSEVIILVEDQPSVRRFAARTLHRLGYRLIEATNGAEALERCLTDNEHIDLVLTDIVMPHMSGPDLVEHLRQKRPDIRVLYMTGYAADVLDSRGLLRHDALLLRKPFDAQQLAEYVRRALDEGAT